MKHKILSLVIAVTMLFGTVNFAFAAEGATTDIQAEIDQLKVELEATKAQIEEAKASGVATEAEIAEIQAKIDATNAQYEHAKEALMMINASVQTVSVTFNGAAVTANWEAIDYADKYTVKLYRNGKVAKTVKNVTGTTYTWKNLARGCYYKATVTPVEEYTLSTEAEMKDYAGKAKMSAAKFNKFKAPTTLTVKKANGKVQLKSADRNSTGFQVYISTSKNFKKNVKKVKLTSNYKALNKKISVKKYLKKGKNYIKVRPYTKWNGKTYYGKWSAVKTVKR